MRGGIEMDGDRAGVGSRRAVSFLLGKYDVQSPRIVQRIEDKVAP